jgi:hypothetical protein
MGLFDTIFFEEPKICSSCGAKIDSVQTKAFDPALLEYRVGDVVSGSPLLSGVIREDLFCNGCNTMTQAVYLAIWHTLLVGVYDTEEEAEARITKVDRAELLDYIARHQKQSWTWHNRFSRLFGDLRNLYDYQHELEEEGEIAANTETVGKIRNLRFFRIKEILDTKDPLAALIEAHRPENPEDETELKPAE